MAIRAVISGRNAANSAPKATPSTIRAKHDAGQGAARAALRGRVLDVLAAQRHLELLVTGRLGGGDNALHGRLGQALGLLVEADRGERDSAVLADLAGAARA